MHSPPNSLTGGLSRWCMYLVVCDAVLVIIIIIIIIIIIWPYTTGVKHFLTLASCILSSGPFCNGDKPNILQYSLVVHRVLTNKVNSKEEQNEIYNHMKMQLASEAFSSLTSNQCIVQSHTSLSTISITCHQTVVVCRLRLCASQHCTMYPALEKLKINTIS